MAVQRKQYTKEFKKEAVRLITEGGISLAQVSRDLDVNQNVLRRWKQELEQHGSEAFPGQGVPIEQELARLRRENEVLRQEREILKKPSPSSRNTNPEARLHPRPQRAVPYRALVPCAGREPQRLLCMEEAATQRP